MRLNLRKGKRCSSASVRLWVPRKGIFRAVAAVSRRYRCKCNGLHFAVEGIRCKAVSIFSNVAERKSFPLSENPFPFRSFVRSLIRSRSRERFPSNSIARNSAVGRTIGNGCETSPDLIAALFSGKAARTAACETLVAVSWKIYIIAKSIGTAARISES